MENKSKYSLMLGNALQLEMEKIGLNQKDLAIKICAEYPKKDNDKPRNIRTTANNIGNIIKGTALHLDTFNKALQILGIDAIEFKKFQG